MTPEEVIARAMQLGPSAEQDGLIELDRAALVQAIEECIREVREDTSYEIEMHKIEGLG